MLPFFARSLFLPTFAWNYLLARVLHRRHWWDSVDPDVILGALPLKRDVPKLAKLQVRGVINMCQEYPGPKEAYQQHNIEQLWLPTVDFNPPSLEAVQKGVEFLHQKTKQNQRVYVHCKAGRARSATIVICWLVKHRGMSPEQAQAHLLACRPHVNPRLLSRPVVREFLGLDLSSPPSA
ncbi:MAG: phosphatidylglycerophosphatase and protein-tyrosine phosphatase 1 family protein [Pirellula sp.]